MPEWPELRAWSGQAQQALQGAALDRIETQNEKMLNLPLEALNAAVRGRRVRQVRNMGKWMLFELDEGLLGLNFNMGADFCLDRQPMENTRLQVFFADGRVFSIRFWFLGYLVYGRSLALCPALASLGPDCMALSKEGFCALLKGRRSLKNLLLDQHTLCGIGNFYLHDLLFLAGLHPARQAGSLSQAEKEGLFEAMHALFERAAAQGGAAYEHDLFFQSGHYRQSFVGYKERQACPRCGAPIEKIKLGASHVYLCANCQH